MKKPLIFLVIVVVLNVSLASAFQNPDVNVYHLTPKGRAAYQKLFSASVFRVGGVGYLGRTSAEELALYDLLAERDAVECLKSLVHSASYVGGLYGLLGLSITNVAEFDRAVDVYNARQDQPERKSQEPFSDLKLSRNEVVTQFGCIISTEDRLVLVGSIQSGRLEKLLRRNSH